MEFMFPLYQEIPEHGHKAKSYVPVRSRIPRARSQSQGLCSRCIKKSKSTVTKRRVMFPLDPEIQEHGHKTKIYVPVVSRIPREWSHRQCLCDH